MARKKPKVIPFRRKREQKTHYKKRLKLLTSKRTRLVFRRYNNTFLGQFIAYKPEGDTIVSVVNSSELRKLGWSHSCGNISAAYLTGLLLGKKGLDRKVKDAILDIGMHHSVAGSRIYAFAKGVVDSGVDVPVSEEVFPSEERLSGAHIVAISEKASGSQFSKLKKDKIDPKKISADFEKVKKKILELDTKKTKDKK
jgi:large subunit ribosomal protein L18